MKYFFVLFVLISQTSYSQSDMFKDSYVYCKNDELEIGVFYPDTVYEDGEVDSVADLFNQGSRILIRTHNQETFEFNNTAIVTDGAGNEFIKSYIAQSGLTEVVDLFFDHEEPYLRGSVVLNENVILLNQQIYCRGPYHIWSYGQLESSM